MDLKKLFFTQLVVAAALLAWCNLLYALQAGVNIDVHQDIPCDLQQQNCPNDFHVEGLICSNGSTPMLVDHVDGLFSPPNGNFSYTLTPAGLPDPCWYKFTADWWLLPPSAVQGIPFCTVLHMGLLFDVEASNVMIDLQGWWTRDGKPVGEIRPLPNGGFVPILGFDVRDTLDDGQKLRIANGNVIQPPAPTPPIPVEILKLDVVAFPAATPPDFRDLQQGGAQATYPWVPVKDASGNPISPTNPVVMSPDSFFDVFLEVAMPGKASPATPVTVPPGGFLVARQQIAFTNNAGLREERWEWEIHGAQPAEACCLPDGSCQELAPFDCMQQGGTPQGANTTCAQTVCQTLGACCYGTTAPACMVTDQITCEQQFMGIWKGPGTTCDDADGDGVADVCETPQQQRDWGDAPDQPYPTRAANNGANHIIVPNMFLGNLIDPEPDGQPDPNAKGDDLANTPDEDGVVFLSPLARGRTARIQVTASVAGKLDAWMDFSQNGSWADAVDQIFSSVPLNPGVNTLTFVVPKTATLGQTFARFRYSSAGGLSYTGPANDGEVEDYTVTIKPARIVGRLIFYNQSYWDGNNSAANAMDDAAVAPDKTALLPGSAATAANYISYNKSINGVMIDIADLAGTPTAADFQFLNAGRNASGAGLLPAPSSITVRPMAGIGGSDRVTIIWPNNAIPNTVWLKTRVLPTLETGLAGADVFYFGIAMGESLSPTTGLATVNATDEIDARNDPHSIFDPATISNKHDYNRDRYVNATDQLISRNNSTSIFNALVLVGSAPP